MKVAIFTKGSYLENLLKLEGWKYHTIYNFIMLSVRTKPASVTVKDGKSSFDWMRHAHGSHKNQRIFINVTCHKHVKKWLFAKWISKCFGGNLSIVCRTTECGSNSIIKVAAGSSWWQSVGGHWGKQTIMSEITISVTFSFYV